MVLVSVAGKTSSPSLKNINIFKIQGVSFGENILQGDGLPNARRRTGVGRICITHVAYIKPLRPGRPAASKPKHRNTPPAMSTKPPLERKRIGGVSNLRCTRVDQH